MRLPLVLMFRNTTSGHPIESHKKQPQPPLKHTSTKQTNCWIQCLLSGRTHQKNTIHIPLFIRIPAYISVELQLQSHVGRPIDAHPPVDSLSFLGFESRFVDLKNMCTFLGGSSAPASREMDHMPFATGALMQSHPEIIFTGDLHIVAIALKEYMFPTKDTKGRANRCVRRRSFGRGECESILTKTVPYCTPC